MADNLALWNSVSRTDPAYTKNFTRGGGFKGTAINATYLARLATEKFGPIGVGWGIEVVDEAYIEGAPIITDGQVVCKEVIHKIRAKLWYKLGDERGEVTQYGLTTFIGKNKFGPFTDEEAPKKSMTDAMTKCLSLLGFAADVHTGKFDDNKYVNDVRAYFENEKRKQSCITEEQARQLAQLIAQSGASAEGFLKFMKVEELEHIEASQFERAKKALTAKLEKNKPEGRDANTSTTAG